MLNNRGTESLIHIESKLGEFVCSYLDDRDGTEAVKDHQLQLVCEGLEYLLGGLLEGHAHWNGWVDGIFPAMGLIEDAVQTPSPGALRVRGSAMWGIKASGPFWIEPFLGTVWVTEEAKALIAYEIKFADSSRPLGRFAYGKHISTMTWFSPTKWLYEFSKSTADKHLR